MYLLKFINSDTNSVVYSEILLEVELSRIPHLINSVKHNTIEKSSNEISVELPGITIADASQYMKWFHSIISADRIDRFRIGTGVIADYMCDDRFKNSVYYDRVEIVFSKFATPANINISCIIPANNYTPDEYEKIVVDKLNKTKFNVHVDSDNIRYIHDNDYHIFVNSINKTKPLSFRGLITPIHADRQSQNPYMRIVIDPDTYDYKRYALEFNHPKTKRWYTDMTPEYIPESLHDELFTCYMSEIVNTNEFSYRKLASFVIKNTVLAQMCWQRRGDVCSMLKLPLGDARVYEIDDMIELHKYAMSVVNQYKK